MVSATAQNRSMTSLGAHLEVCSVLAADFDRSIVVFTAALVDIMKARERELISISWLWVVNIDLISIREHKRLKSKQSSVASFLL